MSRSLISIIIIIYLISSLFASNSSFSLSTLLFFPFFLRNSGQKFWVRNYWFVSWYLFLYFIWLNLIYLSFLVLSGFFDVLLVFGWFVDLLLRNYWWCWCFGWCFGWFVDGQWLICWWTMDDLRKVVDGVWLICWWIKDDLLMDKGRFVDGQR